VSTISAAPLRDAAKTYKGFVALIRSTAPRHGSACASWIPSPRAGSQAGTESKREFASKYGSRPNTGDISNRKSRRKLLAYSREPEDLATHYHASIRTQTKRREAHELSRASNGTALLESFRGADSASVNYQLADCFWRKGFRRAAKHMSARLWICAAPAVGSCRIRRDLCIREQLKLPTRSSRRRQARYRRKLAQICRRIPQDEHSAVVLGAAADDMYEMKTTRLPSRPTSASSISIRAQRRRSGVRMDCGCARFIRAR